MASELPLRLEFSNAVTTGSSSSHELQLIGTGMTWVAEKERGIDQLRKALSVVFESAVDAVPGSAVEIGTSKESEEEKDTYRLDMPKGDLLERESHFTAELFIRGLEVRIRVSNDLGDGSFGMEYGKATIIAAVPLVRRELGSYLDQWTQLQWRRLVPDGGIRYGRRFC